MLRCFSTFQSLPFSSGVLLKYLSAGLGDTFTEEVSTAWTKLLNAMATVVQGELDNISSNKQRQIISDKPKGPFEIPHYILKPEDVKAIEESFSLVAASASVQDLGIGFFRL